jgi:hypothetical protein
MKPVKGIAAVPHIRVGIVIDLRVEVTNGYTTLDLCVVIGYVDLGFTSSGYSF